MKLGIGQKPEVDKKTASASKQLQKFLKMSQADDQNPAAVYLQNKKKVRCEQFVVVIFPYECCSLSPQPPPRILLYKLTSPSPSGLTTHNFPFLVPFWFDYVPQQDLKEGARLLEILSFLGEKHILCVTVIEQWLLLLAHLMGVSKIIQFAVAESDVKRVAMKVPISPSLPPPPPHT